MTSCVDDRRAALEMTRRRFIGTGAAATALLAAGNLVGCENRVTSVEGSEDRKGSSEAVWVSAACWHNCGGRCVNKALVKDGVAVRQKTDDSHEDSPVFPQQRSCIRGHSQRKQCFAADRLKYPMKRKHWKLDDPQGQLRGKDEWERISWNEAFEYVAGALKKVYEEHGPRSVLSRGGNMTMRVLEAMGGCCGIADTTSMGTYCLDTTKLGMPLMDSSSGSANDRFDLKHADWIVFEGCNPAWASPGSPCYHYIQARDAGTRFVMISPSCNATAQMLDARWIPVRAGTDTAFMLAVAYEMVVLDQEQGNIVDWDFLNECTVGFDSRHMPDDARLDENFEDYLMGSYDGTPKTAEWASVICGTPVDDIRWYAELLGKNNKVMMLHSFSFARCHDAEDVPQLFMTLGAMGGHFGKSGHACGSTYHSGAANGGPALVVAGKSGLEPIATDVDDRILGPVLWKSILDKRYRHIGDFYANVFTEGEDRDIDIRAIFYEQSARLQTSPDLMRGIEAHRSVDFVFCNAQFFTTQAQYADIVLPVTTEWERVGGLTSGNREALFVYTQVTEPLFEAKTDQEIGIGLAKALGLDPNAVYPLSEKQQFMNQILGSTVMNERGEMEPLVTVTDDDLKAWKCEGSPQEGRIGLEKFLADGCYQVERREGDGYGFIAYQAFVEDPDNHPLPSASGKLEIYCQWKSDTIAGFGFSDCFKPYPTYHPAVEGYETCFTDFAQGTKGEYPYLAYNPHYYRRSHSVLDNVAWLREAWSNPVYISKADAEAKGIVSGDDVCIYNEHGKIVRTASVLETIMPGMVGIPHGSWLELDESEEYDVGGADNVLCGPIVSGMAVTGYNNYTCNFEKYAGGSLTPDCEKPLRTVDVEGARR